ncbi:hypothetical protein J437_LFUL017550 [Ladona fulva]|uniref:Uncharacterized protein n=1 Tax=Ladona fulva TaxID=123851 RepID=A0A8K0P9N6_LADFU|nr:hypothetical protein J437_LFUL017550 [Ladona fulva]
MDSLEQYSGRNCLLVHGVEETPEENCLKTAVTLFRDKLNVQIDVRRLDRAHRVGKPKSDDKPRPVIVKFVSYQDRHQVWLAKRPLKAQVAKVMAGPRNVWTQDGKTIFLRPNGSRVHAISLRDVESARKDFAPNSQTRSGR